jgi:hypothetical protein
MPFASSEAQKEYQRKWRAERREKGIAYLGGKCVKCGSTEDLNIDHKERAHKVSHTIWSWSWERQKVELDKCQLLCVTHHQEKTKQFQEHCQGEENGGAKLTEDQVSDIRLKYSTGEHSQASLGREFGVDRSTIYKIVHRKRW